MGRQPRRRSGDDAGVNSALSEAKDPVRVSEGDPSPSSRLRMTLIALLIAVAAVALAQSWNRWLDPIIDTGRDLYIAEQVAHGTTLYRDIRYQYPPLTPYLLTAFTSIIGSSLAAFTAIGIAQSLAIAVLLWVALRKIAGFAAALLFVTLSFTGASTWGANFVFPYAYAATLGMLFLIGALAAFVRRKNAIAIVLLIAASWCKVEYAAAAFLIVVVLAIARRLKVMEAVVYIVAMCVTAVVAVAYFGPALRDNIFATTLTEGEIARRFFRNVSGLRHWPQNLGIAIASAAAIALIAWLLRTRSKVAIPAVIIAALLFNSDSFFRGWAILQLVALVFAFRERESPLIFFSIFSIAATVRVALAVSPAWYGCALVVPVYALVAYVFFASPFRSQWWLAIIAMICLRDLVDQHQRYAVKQFPIVSSRGMFYDANPDRARVLNELIRTVKGPTLAVMPEGISLNYLTRTRTPLTFYMFTPPETAEPAIEARVLRELRHNPPAEVAIVTRDVREYGFRGFGLDYDQSTLSYIIHNYSVTNVWPAPRFQAILFQHVSR